MKYTDKSWNTLLAGLLLTLSASTTYATTVTIDIKNLASETIKLASGPDGLLNEVQPNGTYNLELNFPNNGSNINIQYRTASGKTCTFKGSHHLSSRYRSVQGVWEKSAIGSGNPSPTLCSTIQTVQRYSAPWDYKLLLLMTD
ncbi:hypothetical protein D9M71_237130 [compost metagenome]